MEKFKEALNSALQGVRDNRFRLHLCDKQAQSILYKWLQERFKEQGTFVWGHEQVQFSEWLTENCTKGILLLGNPGTGKSLLTCEFLPWYLKLRYSLVLPVYMAREMTNDTLRHHIMRYRLKVLDDIGTETMLNDYGVKQEVFSAVIDDAAFHGGFIVGSTNLSVEQIRQRYGQRTFDRLKELCDVIVFKGESLR